MYSSVCVCFAVWSLFRPVSHTHTHIEFQSPITEAWNLSSLPAIACQQHAGRENERKRARVTVS